MSDDSSDEKEKPLVAKTAVDLQRLKLIKLMKNPEKPVIIPERPKTKGTPSVPEFVRNVMGSSAGAGSGEFHVYRHLRRKEYSRQKFIQEKSHKELLDEEYHKKLEENQKKADELTAKKRAKRLKKKRNMKKKKLNNNPNKSNQDESSDAESDSSKEENHNDSADGKEGDITPMNVDLEENEKQSNTNKQKNCDSKFNKQEKQNNTEGKTSDGKNIEEQGRENIAEKANMSKVQDEASCENFNEKGKAETSEKINQVEQKIENSGNDSVSNISTSTDVTETSMG